LTFFPSLQLSLHEWEAPKSIQLSLSTSPLLQASLEANRKHLLISVFVNSTHAEANRALSKKGTLPIGTTTRGGFLGDDP